MSAHSQGCMWPSPKMSRRAEEERDIFATYCLWDSGTPVNLSGTPLVPVKNTAPGCLRIKQNEFVGSSEA